MKTGVKRTLFPLRLLAPVLILVVVATIIYGGGAYWRTQVSADTALFHPEHCLGGWRNVDNIVGKPNVREGEDSEYTDKNSASIENAGGQVFCGGFSGKIPFAATHERVVLHFSWYIDDGNVLELIQYEEPTPPKEAASGGDLVPIGAGENLVETLEVFSQEGGLSEEGGDATSDSIEGEAAETSGGGDSSEEGSQEGQESEAKPESEPEPEPAPAEVSFFQSLFTIAYAQETESEVVVAPEVSSEETAEAESPVIEAESSSDLEVPVEQFTDSAPEDAYFKVMYTLDGSEWHSLGYVTRIANDIEIELPTNLLSTVEDLEKVQIALQTVERYDEVPKIYLDSLWLEVFYSNDKDAIPPPGQKEGDVIFSKTIYQGDTAVVVLRNVGLMTLSNILSEAASTTPPVVAASTTATSSEGLASSTTTETSVTQFVSTSTLAQVIQSTGVEVELWLLSSSTQVWTRVADDSIISRNPQVKFADGHIFWADRNDVGVWRYNPKSGGYDALSVAEGGFSAMRFRDEAGELQTLDFSHSSSSMLLEEIKPAPENVE